MGAQLVPKFMGKYVSCKMLKKKIAERAHTLLPIGWLQYCLPHLYHFEDIRCRRSAHKVDLDVDNATVKCNASGEPIHAYLINDNSNLVLYLSSFMNFHNITDSDL